MTGCCLRCGRLGPIEADHPAGRYRGAALHPLTVPLCRACHVAKGRTDRAAGVEGGRPSLRLVVRRLAAFLGFVALLNRSMPAWALLGLATILELVAEQLPADLPWRMP